MMFSSRLHDHSEVKLSRYVVQVPPYALNTIICCLCVCICVCVCVQLTAGAEGGLTEEAFLHNTQAGAAAERVRLHEAVPGDGAAPSAGGAGQVH